MPPQLQIGSVTGEVHDDGDKQDKMSHRLHMATRKLNGYDTDSSSECQPDEEDKQQHAQSENEDLGDCPWRSAVDPNTGKTYYYHVETRETQWRKPMEMASREEREALAAKERRQKDFFAAMEANILKSISQGQKAPEKKNKLDIEFDNKDTSIEPLSTHMSAGASEMPDSSTNSRSRRRAQTGVASEPSRGGLIRTISSMDTSVLRELIQRVPSSRVIRTGGSNHSSRQLSQRALARGSSHHSRQGRIQRLGRNVPGLGGRQTNPQKQQSPAPTLIEKMKRENSKRQTTVPDDDDELPPLTVVTTPDLREREIAVEKTSQDKREMMSRGDSLTLDQLHALDPVSKHSSASGNNFMDSRFLLDHSSGGSGFSWENNSSFHTDGSINEYGGGGSGGNLNMSSSGRDSFGHMSAASNLLPVQEGEGSDDDEEKDEEELTMDFNKRMSIDPTREIVLEGDEETSPEDASFSLGNDSFNLPDENTANWLDALPQDDSNKEDLVGYGSQAKPFADAGFTSFFDESMANFDLSDKETRALQKLAQITEEMAKVTEGDEDDDEESDEESDEDSDDSSDIAELIDMDDGNGSFQLSFESSDDEESVLRLDEEDSSADENEIKWTPPVETPRTTSAGKTIGTLSAESNSPPSVSFGRKPAPQRMLGPKAGGVGRNLCSIEPLSDEKGVSDGDSPGRGSLSPAKMSMAAATLTIDNARGHFSEAANNSSGSRQLPRLNQGSTHALVSPNRQGKRSKRHLMDGNRGNTSSGSLHNSSSSLGMATAARRISLFRLKNIDKSQLRHVENGQSPDVASAKGLHHGTDGQAKGDISVRPNLVRRNTCGTLYVGTTMSAPDKDATIKCVCGVYRAHILQSEMEGDDPAFHDDFRIFNDLESQQGHFRKNKEKQRSPKSQPIPSLDQITTFYRDVFTRAQMEYDCIIISLIYVERLIKTTTGGLRPRACNWRSILFSCMVLASKVWDDLSMWNADFSQTCPSGVKFSLKRINELEVAILSALSYKVKVPASEYAKYYFLLRSMLIKSGLIGDNVDTTTPLDVEGAKRLQQVSSQFQSGMGATRREMRKAKSMRSKSMGHNRLRAAVGARTDSGTTKKVNLEHVVTM